MAVTNWNLFGCARVCVLVLAAGLFASGCAHQQVAGSTAANAAVNGDDKPPSKELESFKNSDPEPPEVVDEELESIPMDYNEKVEQWLRYFQGKGRPHMERYLSRMPKYGKIMKKILRDNGLPEDLIYVALIESGFSPKATSRAAAVGYWQFIRGTGRRYGLAINSMVDERRDPILSTQAASEYFKGLYSVFGSWYLAMASYNVGENRIKKEVMKHMTRDFWALARIKRFPKETKNYIPKFIAAKMIAHDPKKYGFIDIEADKPIEFELIRTTKPVNLRAMAAKLNYDYDDLKSMNPKFKGEIAPLKDEDGENVLELRVPIGQKAAALAAAEASVADKVELIADAGETETYKVRRGDSLYTIARRYHTNLAVLRDLNELSPGRKLRIGMHLQIPERGSGHAKPASVAKVKVAAPVVVADDEQKATEETEVHTPEGRFYVVQKGDNLSQIADEYDCTITELRKLNGLRRGSLLRIGMHLKVPSEDTGIPAEPDSESVVPSRGPQTIIPVSHTVRRGETLNSIAKKYGVSIESLMKANKLSRRSVLRTRYHLLIPVGSSNYRLRDKLNKKKIQVARYRAKHRNFVKSVRRTLAMKKETRAHFYRETARVKGNETID